MEIKLTFDEEIAVSTAIRLRILDLSKTIHDCRTPGQEPGVLLTSMATLKSAFRKISGVDFDSVYHD